MTRFHRLQIELAASLCALCIIGYLISPREKEQTLSGIIILLIGFLTGKFTNGFKRGAEEDKP